jgi:cytochrome P450
MSVSLDTPVVYNPFAADFYEDPYPTYQRLRDEAPVYYSPEFRFWVLSRFDDVRAAATDAVTFITGDGIDVGEPITTTPGFITDIDNPRHDQLRGIVQRAFLPRSVAKLEEDVRGVVCE